MAKFSFNDSKYVKMFEDSLYGKQIISAILNDPNLIRANYTQWQKWFRVDPNITPTAADGTASFTVEARYPTHSDLMDWRAPLGDSLTGEEGESVKNSGSIPDFIAKGWRESAMEREYKEKIFADYGSDAPLLLGYATDVLQPRIDSANQTLTNLSAVVMSTGKSSYKYGSGIKGSIYAASIPDACRVNAGSKIWAAEDCQLLSQMVEIEKHFREDVWGLENIALTWDIPYDMFVNVFLKNKQVIETIKFNWLASNGQLVSQVENVPNTIVTEETFNTYVVGRFPGLSPIRVVAEHQNNLGTRVQGWKEGIACLHPTGYSGLIMHSDILDEKLYTKYGNTLISRAFGKTLDGLLTVMNYTLPDGNMKSWGMDVMMSALPVLDDFLWHVLVDTTTAD